MKNKNGQIYKNNQLFQNIETQKNSTLFFSHILVPHIPYTYDEDCNFDGYRSINFNRISVSKKRLQHNLEKKCLIEFKNSSKRKKILK